MGSRDFAGGPLVKTPRFQCRGCSFNPWLRNYNLTCCMVVAKKKRIWALESHLNSNTSFTPCQFAVWIKSFIFLTFSFLICKI